MGEEAIYRERRNPTRRATIAAVWGTILIFVGLAGFLTGAFLGAVRLLLPSSVDITQAVELLIWYSALPVVLGLLAILGDLLFIVTKKRRIKAVRNDPLARERVTVALTAYNDEASIGPAVQDFLSSRHVQRVIVISNNSVDGTMAAAEAAGASIVLNETKQGYGACVVRALTEAVKFDDTEVVVLCEGDRTFRAYDVPKLLAYMPHADVVNGTRIVEQLQESDTQISTFIHYGNFAVAKLLEIKYLGEATLSDVGTTYKAIRRDALMALLPHLEPEVNLEFNPHFLEQCIRRGFSVIECPITFHPRVGISKGGNVSDRTALRVGLRMILGILLGWQWVR